MAMGINSLFWLILTWLGIVSGTPGLPSSDDIASGPVVCRGYAPNWIMPRKWSQQPWEGRFNDLYTLCSASSFMDAMCFWPQGQQPYMAFRPIDDNSWMRATVAARNFCWCEAEASSSSTTVVTAIPKGYPPIYNPLPPPVRRAFQIRIEEPDSHVTNIVPDSDRMGIALPIQAWRVQEGIDIRPAPGRDIAASLHPDNAIVCNPNIPVPDLPYPLPYEKADFSDLQQLCPVALSGGNLGANAGGYCHETSVPRRRPWKRPTSEYDVRFTDEMTPLREWRWRPNFMFSFQLRYTCLQHCRCRNGKGAKMGSRDSWTISQGAILSRVKDADNGGWLLSYKDGPDYHQRNARIYDSGIFYGPWDTPTYHLNQLAKPAEAVFPPQADWPMCGQHCSGPTVDSCYGGGSAGEMCRCVVTAFSRVEGRLDRVFDEAKCLIVPGLVSITTSEFQRQKDQTLGGRDALPVASSQEEEYVCPCNMTYVSRACCDSNSGLLWESDGRIAHDRI